VTIASVVTALGNSNFCFGGLDCAVALTVCSDKIPA
jgi:hypothetical protein